MKILINSKMIASAIKTVVLEVASPKTLKYFVGDEDKFSVNVEAFANTISYIVANSEKTSVYYKGDNYHLTEYQVNSSIQELANASKIYVATGTQYSVEPWFEADFVISDDVTIWSPLKFNAFYAALRDNINKDVADFIKPTTNFINYKEKCVYELTAAVTTDGNLAKLAPSGVVDYAVQILNIPNIFPDECVHVYERYNERGIGKWLLGK